MHPSGYVLKPVSSKDVAVELRSLRTPVDRRAAARVRIECFGGFEVYVSGERLNITRPTCKELLAFLVHRRGKGVTASEIAATLWPEKRYTRSLQSQIQKTIKNLRVLLDEHGIGDIVVRERNYIALETSLVSCDFYEYLAGTGTSGLDAYRGLYLEPYAWADLPITGTRLERLA